MAKRHVPGPICRRCGREWPRTSEYFRPKATNRDGLSGTCRRCNQARTKEWTEANKAKANEVNRAWKAANPDKVREHKVRALAKARAARGFVPQTDEQKREARRSQKRRHYARSARHRLIQRVRNRTLKALSGEIKLGLTQRWLGCTPAELMAHLEAQFQPGMTWENRGEWHVDHVRPLASFDLSDPEQRREACHFTNLQPLWAADNLAKGARLDWAA